MKSKFKILVELTKLRITVFVTLTTAVGFIAAAGELNSAFIAPVVGILILACGSAIVNHIQERNTDALMNRTKGRPIPSGQISVKSARSPEYLGRFQDYSYYCSVLVCDVEVLEGGCPEGDEPEGLE